MRILETLMEWGQKEEERVRERLNIPYVQGVPLPDLKSMAETDDLPWPGCKEGGQGESNSDACRKMRLKM